MEVPQKTKLPYVPLLGMHLEKTIIQKDTCAPVFIATLFIIAKTWKQLFFFNIFIGV